MPDDAGSAAGGGADASAEDGSRLLAGRYRLGEVIGSGGMGTVWRAEDTLLGRTVAVKELRLPHALPSEEQRTLQERTFREARAAARIDHPSAVTVHDVVDHDQRPWLVMEYVEGRSLADALREDGPMPPARAAELGLAVLDALEAAHRVGVLHRDVKPANVLLRDDGRVVLTDFGIATTIGDSSITSTGRLLGSPAYIPPERVRGIRSGPASDLWALGATLYTAVEGRPPFEGAEAVVTLTRAVSEPPDPPQAAGPLAEVLLGLLEKDPEARWDAATTRRALQRVARDSSAAATSALPAAAAAATTSRPDPVAVVSEADVWRVPDAADPRRRAARESASGAGRRSLVLVLAALIAVLVLAVGAVLLMMQGLVGGAATESTGTSTAEPQETVVEEGEEPQEETEGLGAGGAETTDVFSLAVGDCFNDPENTELGGEDSSQVEELPVVACEQPHDNEVYASLGQPDGQYPGDEEIQGIADEGCIAEFEGYVGVAFEESEFNAFPITPTAESWEQGDREVLCALFGEGQETGSAQNSGR